MSLLEDVKTLRENFKKAFMPVPPHPDYAPPEQGAPPPADPAMQGAPPQGAPPPADPAMQGAPPVDPAMQGAPPPADPGPPPINPDVIAALQEVTSKVEEFGKMQSDTQQRLDQITQELAHERALRDQRKELISTFTQ